MSSCKVTFVCFAALITTLTAFVVPDGAILKRAADSASSEESDEIFAESITVLYDMCTKNADRETFERVIELVAAAPTCIGDKIDLEKFTQDVESISASNRVEFFSTYCPQVNDSLSCLDASVAEVRKCIDDDVKELYDLINDKLIPKALNIACKDDGEIFFMGMEKLESCFTNIANNQTGCFVNISNSTMELDIATFGPKQCTELSGIHQCVQNHLNDCQLSRLMELIDLFYEPFIKQTPCLNYINSDDESSRSSRQSKNIYML